MPDSGPPSGRALRARQKRAQNMPARTQPSGQTPYAELQVTTNFSFLRGGSHPDELVAAAKARGLSAIAVTDRNSLAGAVRMHIAAREAGLRLVVGCRLDLMDGPSLLCWPRDRTAYGRLSRLLSKGKMDAPKGACHITLADVLEAAEGQCLAVIPPDRLTREFREDLEALARQLPGLHLVAAHRYQGRDRARIARLAALAGATGTRLLATNDVHMHVAERRDLQDVLTCIREGVPIDRAGYLLAANAERHIKAPDEMARLFRGHEDALQASLDIAEACTFSLDELRYEYPDEPVPPARPRNSIWRT